MLNRVLLLKVFMWRLISIPISVMATYFYTGEVRTSLNLTIILTIVLTACQFAYERAWRAFSVDRVKKTVEALSTYKKTLPRI